MSEEIQNRGEKRNGISARRAILILTGVVFVISVLLILSTYRATGSFLDARNTTDHYIQLQRDASDLQAGSDDLTEMVRCFAQTGDRRFLDSYFEEANVTRKRDRAVASIHEYMGDTPAYQSLVSAMGESVSLMDREYYSMRLKAEACGYDLSSFPEEIRNVVLSPADQKLSETEKDALARSMVFDETYRTKKDAISENVQACLAELSEAFETGRTSAEDQLSLILSRQRILVIITVTISLLTLLGVIYLLVKPLTEANSYIQEGKTLPPGGSSEFRFLAETYNRMYKTNQEQKESISALFNNMPAMSFSKDAKTGVYLACNQAFAQYAHKKDPSGVTGLRDEELFDPETARHFIEDDRIALSMEKPYVFLEDVPDAAGKHRQLQTTKLKYIDPSGRECLLGMCADVTDIRAQIRADNMITAMASDYRCVYYVNLDENECICYRDDASDPEQTPAGISFPYLERAVWYAENCVAERYREGFLDFIQPDHIRARLENEPIIAYRYLVKRPDREYYEMIRAAGVRRAEERDDHMVHEIGMGLTVIDAEMRESMAKNEALAEALAAAEEASRAKTVFLSNMSHEIRTPMNAIIGLDTLALHDESISQKTRDYLKKIGDSAHHLLALINDILDMSRIESGRIVLRREEFSFSGMLEQINTMVLSQCSDKGLRYECRLLSSVEDYFIGDVMKLKEVLINILSNAIKFTDAPGLVTMSVEKTAEFEGQTTLKFCIRDTGIGMDPEFIPKIFDAFSQADSGRTSKYGSTGLGMAITKRLVEMMDGTISVESEKGAGTEFTVIITLKNAGQDASLRDHTVDPHKMRVLVVDDEEISAEHARTVLEDAGIRSDVCMSPEEALRMIEVAHLKQQPYNLVLLDWRMPERDGVETAKEIRDRYSNETTVVILTAYNWDDIIEEAAQAGVDSFLAKPLIPANVIAEFERIARRHKNLFEEKKQAELNGRRILLAEDIEINAEIMMDVLDMEGMSADHALNGRIAVEKFEQSEPGMYSAILMDVQMPEMDGLEAAAAIRKSNHPDAKKIPIIALTANAFDEDVHRSLQAGMNAHLSKPVEPDHLYRTLKELIYEAEHPEEERIEKEESDSVH